MAKEKLDRDGRAMLIRTAIAPFFQILLFFAVLGRFDAPGPWIYLPAGLIAMLGGIIAVALVNPELVNRRGRWKKLRGAKQWDKPLLVAFGVPGFHLVPIVAALDIRLTNLPRPCMVQMIVATAVFLAASAFLHWAMIANRHFEVTVRIQTDRDHKVIDTGPYRIVRHPGYVGVIVWILSSPLIFGSYLGLIPALISAAVLVYRTAREDRTLCEELPGYAEFATRTKYRLVPGIW